MAWTITCSKCNAKTVKWNIVDLIGSGTEGIKWFECELCGEPGWIEKRFNLQETGATWDPYLHGVIKLGRAGETHQPFAFLVSRSKVREITSVWIGYYKDLRASGGRLKMGYGPGGPPVLSVENMENLTSMLQVLKC
jgi:hypothetical protein